MVDGCSLLVFGYGEFDRVMRGENERKMKEKGLIL
jgi:hypothetical protein